MQNNTIKSQSEEEYWTSRWKEVEEEKRLKENISRRLTVAKGGK